MSVLFHSAVSLRNLFMLLNIAEVNSFSLLRHSQNSYLPLFWNWLLLSCHGIILWLSLYERLQAVSDLERVPRSYFCGEGGSWDEGEMCHNHFATMRKATSGWREIGEWREKNRRKGVPVTLSNCWIKPNLILPTWVHTFPSLLKPA